jgi:hypothetical protein
MRPLVAKFGLNIEDFWAGDDFWPAGRYSDLVERSINQHLADVSPRACAAMRSAVVKWLPEIVAKRQRV